MLAAQLARIVADQLAEVGDSPDPRYLLPDPIETMLATEQLAKEGFS